MTPVVPEKVLQQRAAFGFGIIFIVALIVLAIVFPAPTPFQYTVFRVVLALAAAGIAAMIPGFIQVEIPEWVRAGGALAVFLIVYFYNPAALVVQAPPEPALSLGAIAHTPRSPESPDILRTEVQNGGKVGINATVRLTWEKNGDAFEIATRTLEIPTGETDTLSTSTLLEAGQHRVSVRLEKGDIVLAERSETVIVTQPASAESSRSDSTPAQRPRENPFEGRWLLAFHFERNTGSPEEPPHPWINFVCTFSGNSQRMVGLVTSSYVNGRIDGFVDGANLRGRMRLNWDTGDWESFRLSLNKDGRMGTGNAIFLNPDRPELHHYSVIANRL